LIPDNEDSDTKAGRMDASGEDASASKPDESRMNQELKQLDSLFNPSGMERQLIIENDEDGNGTDKEVPFLFLIG
jgi:hypothetical protein